MVFDDEYFMRQALIEAQKAFDEGEIPIGAVLVWKNRIIARAYNQTEKLQDPTAHAEMLVITSATQAAGGKYLQDTTLYVTVEPCVMCAGAMFWSKISRLVYGASEPKTGFLRFETVLQMNDLSIIHPKLKITGGVLADEAAELMRKFFEKRRG